MKNTTITSLTIILSIFNLSCASEANDGIEEITEDTISSDTIVTLVEEVLPLDSFFTPIDTSFTTNTLLVPEGFNVQILFTEKIDSVTKASGGKFPAKGSPDMLAFIADATDPNSGWMYVSHETKYPDANLGDGGGATMFHLTKDDKQQWNRTTNFEYVDFTTVGNTERNCGGTIAPNGLIYTCEEFEPKDNAGMSRKGKGHSKTDSVGNLDYWQNFGYVVEVDPVTKKAKQKMIAMGRFFHEDLEFMDDKKTVYLSDDYEPAVFFKFVADKESDYSQGQLYAYQQLEEGAQGKWLALARDTDTMIRARDAAIELGASMFMRHEWFARIEDKIFIGETGHDEANWSKRIASGGFISNGLKPHTVGSMIKDPYGRILVFDTKTDKMSTFLECGIASDGKTVVSNPDCVSPARIGGKNYLIIHEDINWNDQLRVSEQAFKKNKFYNELYFVDADLSSATPNDVKRFAVAPMGAEFTGGIMSPDGSTLFLNIQHPHPSNEAPYNKSVTVAITGWKK